MHAASLRRNSLSFNAVSTFYKAGNAVAQSAGISLEKMATERGNAPQLRRPSPGRFDLVRPPVNSAGRDPSTRSPNRGPSKATAQKRISIGFGAPKPVETRRDTIGHAFPSREKVKNGHDRKANGKADFSVSPSIKQRAQRRNTIAHQALAARATTKSTRTLNLSALREEDMEILSIKSGDEETTSASLKPSSSTPDCAEFANQSIRRNSQDYRSHVEYYRPKLQLNRCSAIKQGCSTQEDIHQMTTKLQQAAYNKRLSSCSTDSAGPASPGSRRSTPPPYSTLNHIMMMNQSGLEDIADLYRRIESGADIDRAVLSDDSSSSSIEGDTAKVVPKMNEPKEPVMSSVFEKMYRRSSLQ